MGTLLSSFKRQRIIIFTNAQQNEDKHDVPALCLALHGLPDLPSPGSLPEERELLGCSSDQLLSCISEIEKAFEDCSHLNSSDEIMVCINDILAAANCQACLCDVLPFLC